MTVVVVAESRRNRRRDPQPMHNSRLTGSMRVEEILNGHEEIIQGLISMKSETFRSLSNLLGSRELLTPTSNMNVNEQLFIFFYPFVHKALRTGTFFICSSILERQLHIGSLKC